MQLVEAHIFAMVNRSWKLGCGITVVEILNWATLSQISPAWHTSFIRRLCHCGVVNEDDFCDGKLHCMGVYFLYGIEVTQMGGLQ